MVGRLYTKEKILDLKLCLAGLQSPHLQGSVANFAALGCVRFCFLTFVTRKIIPFERTHKNALKLTGFF